MRGEIVRLVLHQVHAKAGKESSHLRWANKLFALSARERPPWGQGTIRTTRHYEMVDRAHAAAWGSASCGRPTSIRHRRATLRPLSEDVLEAMYEFKFADIVECVDATPVLKQTVTMPEKG